MFGTSAATKARRVASWRCGAARLGTHRLGGDPVCSFLLHGLAVLQVNTAVTRTATDAATNRVRPLRVHIFFFAVSVLEQRVPVDIVHGCLESHTRSFGFEPPGVDLVLTHDLLVVF